MIIHRMSPWFEVKTVIIGGVSAGLDLSLKRRKRWDRKGFYTPSTGVPLSNLEHRGGIVFGF